MIGLQLIQLCKKQSFPSHTGRYNNAVHPSSLMHLAWDSSIWGPSHALSRQRLEISRIWEQSRFFSQQLLVFYSIILEISLLLQCTRNAFSGLIIYGRVGGWGLEATWSKSTLTTFAMNDINNKTLLVTNLITPRALFPPTYLLNLVKPD